MQESGDFEQTLMREGLIDEYRLRVYPVVLGTGIRFFREVRFATALSLVEVRAFPSGIT